MFGDQLNIDAQKKKLIDDFRKTHSECANLSDAEILTVMNESLDNVTVNEDEKISAFWNEQNIDFNPLKIEINGNNPKQTKRTNVIVKTENGKTFNITKIFESRINKTAQSLQKTEKENGFIGKAWSGLKNLLSIGASSDKVRVLIDKEKMLLTRFNSDKTKRADIFKELTGQEYSNINLERFISGEIKLKSEQALDGYTEGQDMACDIAGDLLSGIAAVGLYSAVVASMPVGGILITAGAVGLGASCATFGGGAIKAALKLADAANGGREYSSGKRDFATGAFSGLLAPITAGLGGAIGKTIATKFGIEVLKQGTKEGVNLTAVQGLKSALLNPTGYSYNGTLTKQILAYGTEMASDGAIGGAVDTSFRTAYDGGRINEILMSFLEGGIGGFFFAPLIGGGFKLFGKAGNYIGNSQRKSNESDLTVKELLYGNSRGMTTSLNKLKALKTFKTGKLRKQNINFNRFFKNATKRPVAKHGEARFNLKEYNHLLNKINNPYFKKNPKYASEILKEMSEMIKKSDFKGLGNFYRFTDDEMVEILGLVNEKNIDVFKLMLKVNDNGNYTYSGDSFAEMLKIYSACDKELSVKLIKMLAKNKYYSNEKDEINKFITLAQKYPEEMKTLSYNYHPKQIDKIMGKDWKTTEFLLEHMKTSSKEQKELIEILFSPKNPGGYIDSEMMIKILDTDMGLNSKQIITFNKHCNVYSGEEMNKAYEKFAKVKDKKFDFSSDCKYQKNKPMTKEDIFKFLVQMGVSEQESRAFSNFKAAEVIIKMIELDELSDNMLFGGASKVLIIKNMTQFIESNRKISQLEELAMLTPIARYINKENYDLYKLHNLEGDIGTFIQDMNETIMTIECRDFCSIVQKLTGKTIYDKDIYTVGKDMLKVTNLTEEEISTAIKKLNELGLIKEDSNIITLLTQTKVLSELEVTPELKEFAKELSGNKFIEEASVIEILKSVQGQSKDILNVKIGYAKDLIKDLYIGQESVPQILNHLSSDNFALLNKQLSVLKEIAKIDPESVHTYSRFIKADNFEEFNVYQNLINAFKIKDLTDNNIISLIIDLSDRNGSKIEICKFVTELLNKDFNVSKIKSVLFKLDDCKGNSKDFMALYLKGLDINLGSLEESFDDIIMLQVTDIGKMNIKEKLAFYEKLSGMGEEEKNIIKQLGLNYDNLISKIIDSIGVKRPLVSIKAEQSQLFIKQIIANNNPKTEKLLMEYDFAKYGKDGLPLKYPRYQFNNEIEAILKNIPKDEADIILKHFGLVRGEAGFDGLFNNRIFNNKGISEEGQKAAKQVQKIIENFTVNNEVLISDRETKETLDGLIKGLPEFTSIVGKQQHGTHAYSVDIHTLKVLQSAMNNPLYKTLSDQDKTIIKYAILLHDLGKKGGVIDKGHASLSADYTWSILDRYPFPSEIKDRIIDIVDNHHWFEAYNMGTAHAENVAVRCRRPEDLKIYEIFAKADFENVNPTFHLGEKSGGAANQAEFDAYMKGKFKAIEDAVNKIYEKANYIFDTRFMHEGRLFPTQTAELDGKTETFRVLDFNKLLDGEDLEKFGFAPGVTRDNARFVVHMTSPDYSSLETVLRLTESPTYQSSWSSSLVQVKNNTTYWGKDFGLIFDIPQANYSEAFWGNTHSGGNKGLDAFQNFLFGSRKIKKEDVDGSMKTFDVRHYVKNNFMEEMTKLGYDLNETEYASLSKYLFGKKYLSQIRKDIQIGDKVISAKDLVGALEKSRDALFYGYEHSEIVPINPKVKGIFAKVTKLEDCPKEFLKFAKEHDLPIILMEPVKVKDNNIKSNFSKKLKNIKP